jgi:hypothetical protein
MAETMNRHLTISHTPRRDSVFDRTLSVKRMSPEATAEYSGSNLGNNIDSRT